MPKRSAPHTTIVLARGTSSPLSTMLVATRTSASPPANAIMAPSTSSGVMRPWADRIFRSGQASARQAAMRSSPSIRGTTTKLCPPRAVSRLSAACTVARSKGATNVRMGRRRAGGVAMTLRSCRPTSALCSVRSVAESLETGLEGIGPDLVADRDLEHLGRGLGGRLALDQGLQGRDQHGARARSAGRVSIEPSQRRHVLAQDVGRRGGAIIGQAVPGRQNATVAPGASSARG